VNSLRDALIVAAVGAAVLGGFYGKAYLDGRASQAAPLETAKDTAAAAGLTVEGERNTTARVEALLQQSRKIQEATHELVTEARLDPAGASRLEPDRAGRLLAHDQRLCDARPGLCTAPAVDTP
jgi:hypothetical protein